MVTLYGFSKFLLLCYFVFKLIERFFREGVSDRAKRGSDALGSSARSVEFRLRNSGRGGCLFPTQSFDFIYVSSVSWNSD